VLSVLIKLMKRNLKRISKVLKKNREIKYKILILKKKKKKKIK
jgi:hypothetical protein